MRIQLHESMQIDTQQQRVIGLYPGNATVSAALPINLVAWYEVGDTFTPTEVSSGIFRINFSKDVNPLGLCIGTHDLPSINGVPIKNGDAVDYEWYQKEDGGLTLKSNVVLAGNGVSFSVNTKTRRVNGISFDGTTATITSVYENTITKTFYQNCNTVMIGGLYYACRKFSGGGSEVLQSKCTSWGGSSSTVYGGADSVTFNRNGTIRSTGNQQVLNFNTSW